MDQRVDGDELSELIGKVVTGADAAYGPMCLFVYVRAYA